MTLTISCQFMTGEPTDPTGFHPLAMVDMWEDMHALVAAWESKHSANPAVAAAALEEFAAALVQRPKPF